MNNKPIIAIMYDFDKTLCTKDMQEYTFIPKVKKKPQEFWDESNNFAAKHSMDNILSYMLYMLETSRIAKKSIHRNDFVELGKDLEFYPGVEDWFQRINLVAKELGVTVEHYIISSGLREIIEGSSIFPKFKDVFASEYLYDENDIAFWPKNAVNYTTKTQFLFRINKGVLDISNDVDLNTYTPENQRRVPFRNMIYIGDGLTDVPCMKLVKANGGYSIAVYPKGNKKKVENLLNNNRVNFIEEADYSKGKSLESLVSDIMLKMTFTDNLCKLSEKQHQSC